MSDILQSWDQSPIKRTKACPPLGAGRVNFQYYTDKRQWIVSKGPAGTEAVLIVSPEGVMGCYYTVHLWWQVFSLLDLKPSINIVWSVWVWQFSHNKEFSKGVKFACRYIMFQQARLVLEFLSLFTWYGCYDPQTSRGWLDASMKFFSELLP